MKQRAGGTRGRVAMIVAAVALFGVVFASVAGANNLDRRTATNAAKFVAKKDCRNTSGCQDFFVRGLHRVTRHKAVGKIHVISIKNGQTFDCTRQVVIKLDHFTGDITYAVSNRRCNVVG